MTLFNLPDLGEGLAEAEIRTWYVKEGDEVKVDQPLVSVETAKAVVDVPSPQAGRIIKLYGSAGEIIKTHAPLVEFGDETVVGRLEVGQTILDRENPVIGTVQKSSNAIVKAMPAVRALAKQLNVDLTLVTATGTQGQITVEDVKKFSGEVVVQGKVLRGVRHFMAHAMEKSHHSIVPVTILDDVDVTDWLPHTDVSVKLIQAIVAGVKAEPLLNAWFDGQTRMQSVQAKINLGLAMDTSDGLFVPVIPDVAALPAQQLRETIDQLKKSVRERTIAPHDLQGATFTLSNVGTIAGRYSTPIILPPMVGILASGRMKEVVAVVEGKVAVRRMIPLSLTFDHRVVTGGEASRFLEAVMGSLRAI